MLLRDKHQQQDKKSAFAPTMSAGNRKANTAHLIRSNQKTLFSGSQKATSINPPHGGIRPVPFLGIP